MSVSTEVRPVSLSDTPDLQTEHLIGHHGHEHKRE